MSELMATGQALTMSSIELLELDGEPYETFVESARVERLTSEGGAC